jgi:hypothetical protein
MRDRSFPKQVFIALLLLACVGGYPMAVYAGPDVVPAAIAGSLLALVNVLAGYYSIEYAQGRSMTTFFKVVLGGMGLRLLGLAAVLVLLIKFFGFAAGPLVISLGICYVVFLVLEILFIQKKVELHQQR